MQYQADLDEINAVIRKHGLKAEFRNDGWQIYIKVRNGAINYYPSTDRWHTERRKLYYGKDRMLDYIVEEWLEPEVLNFVEKQGNFRPYAIIKHFVGEIDKIQVEVI